MAAPWSLDKLAEAADTNEERLRRYIDHGLLHLQTDGDLEPDSLHRVRLIQFIHSRGFSEKQLVAAIAGQGDLLGMFEELVEPGDPPASLSESASNLGLDGALLSELAQILDWQTLRVGTESDIATLRVVANALELGMPRDALMQIVRVLADAMDHLADAEVRTFHDYVHERFRAQGLVGPELLKANRRVGKPVLELAEPAVICFHRRAYQRAIREDLLRHLTEHAAPPASTPGLEQTTVLFIDLTSFTPLTATMGDQTAADVLRRFSNSVRSCATRHVGRISKQIGDAFMLTFPEPTNAIEFGLAMEGFVDTEPQFPALHIGAHHGGVLYREGDYIGATVNLAARVAAAGAAGQFLITQDLHDAVGDRADIRFTLLPPRRLKGLRDPIRLVEVGRREPERIDRETDPVCGLLLHADDVATRTTWRDTIYAFCCDLCKQAFMENPDRFVAASRD